MKKILALVLAVLMICAAFSLTACGKKKVNAEDALEAISDAAKKTAELNSMKGSFSLKASFDGKIEEKDVKGSVDASGDFTFAGLKGDNPEADLNLKGTVDGIDELKPILGDGEAKASAVLKGGYAYIDLDVAQSIKLKIDASFISGIDPAEVIEEVDVGEYKDYIKKSTVSDSKGNKVYELTFDPDKLKEEIEKDDSEVEVKKIDGAILSATVSKDGYILEIKLTVKSIEIDAGGEGSAKCSDLVIDFKLEDPGKDYTVSEPKDMDSYQEVDLEDLVTGFGF